MLKGFLTSAEVLIFFPRKFNHCFWRSKHNLIYHRQRIQWLAPDRIPFFSALNIPSKVNRNKNFRLQNHLLFCMQNKNTT